MALLKSFTAMDKVENAADVDTQNLETSVDHATPALTETLFMVCNPYALCVFAPATTRAFTTHFVILSCWPLDETDLPTLHWI